MSATLTKVQSHAWARNIVREALWTKPGWPTQEEEDAFFQTDFGKEVERLFAERDAREGKTNEQT